VERVSEAIERVGAGHLPDLAAATRPPAATADRCREELQELASAAVRIACDWQLPCMCVEHLLLAIVQSCARTTPDEPGRNSVAAAERDLVARLHHGVHPKQHAEEMLTRIREAAEGDPGALDDVIRRFETTVSGLATAYIEKDGTEAERVRAVAVSVLRDAVRTFRGRTILEFGLHCWETLQDGLDRHLSKKE
jgi:hypothetical protein